MKITRLGSERYRGSSSTEMTHRDVRWDPHAKALRLSFVHVPDFNTPAHHHWTVYIGIDELRATVDALAEALSGKQADELRRVLSQRLTSLLRIAAACSEYRDAAPADDPAVSQ
jgi:hypothetical protein